MLSLRTIRYCLTAMEQGSLSRASTLLNISQPAISSALAEAETHYGTALVERHHGKGVSPTALGRTFMDEAERLLSIAHDLSNLSDRTVTQASGTVRLGVQEDLMARYAPAILAHCQKDAPNITVQLVEISMDDLLLQRDSRTYDLLLSYDIGIPEGMQSLEIAGRQAHVILPEDHLLNEDQERPIRMRDLVSDPLILYNDAASTRHMLSLFELRGLSPRLSIQRGSFETVRSLVAGGHGIAISFTKPESTISYAGAPLAMRIIADAPLAHRVLIAWDKATITTTDMGPAIAALRDGLSGLVLG